jgi:hypothetical protein
VRARRARSALVQFVSVGRCPCQPRTRVVCVGRHRPRLVQVKFSPQLLAALSFTASLAGCTPAIPTATEEVAPLKAPTSSPGTTSLPDRVELGEAETIGPWAATVTR